MWPLLLVLLRAAVLSATLPAAVEADGAAYDVLDIFSPRSESDYFHNAFQGEQEQAMPRGVGGGGGGGERQELVATGGGASDLTRAPPRPAPSKVALDSVTLPVDTSAGFAGWWNVVSENSGVSAMHLVVMRHGKAIMFDTSTTGRSLMRLPVGGCRLDPRNRRPGAMDCWAHAVEFDYNTGALRSLKIVTDTWCSSGAFDADGNLVQTGGYFEGEKAVRYLSACGSRDWKEFPKSLAAGRWYGTQHVLSDGGFIVISGRRAFSYQFVPPAGQTNAKAMPLRLLRESTDEVENNLYPFVNLLPDGTLFIFVNDHSVVFDYRTGQVVRELLILPGGAQNYPASGMSVLLPLELRRGASLTAEVIICGGATKNTFRLGENNSFPPALWDCARINPSKPRARWARTAE